MRRLAERLGIRAPPSTSTCPTRPPVETAIIATGLENTATALKAALDAGAEPLAAAYRAFAFAHPHLYRLMTDQPLPCDLLPAGIDDRAAAPLLRAAGGRDPGPAVWAFAHGMIMLELAGRFPPGADLDAAWQQGITAFQTNPAADARQPAPTTRPR